MQQCNWHSYTDKWTWILDTQLQTYLLRLVVNFYLNIDTLAIRSRSLHITRDRAVTFVQKNFHVSEAPYAVAVTDTISPQFPILGKHNLIRICYRTQIKVRYVGKVPTFLLLRQLVFTRVIFTGILTLSSPWTPTWKSCYICQITVTIYRVAQKSKPLSRIIIKSY